MWGLIGKSTIFCRITAICCLLIMCAACTREPTPAGPKYELVKSDSRQAPYRLAVHPLHNPTKLGQSYLPLIDYLNRRIPGSAFVLEASRDYAFYEAKIAEEKLELLLPNPWQTLEAMKHGYEVIAMAGDPADFKGIFIVRRDSGITRLSDLKGKAISYPAPTALAACIMPQWYLHGRGINVNRDIKNRYVGSQESSIMNVYQKQTVAGATWPPAWRGFQKEHPREAAVLKVIWETAPLINNSVMLKKELPEAFKQQVRAALLDLGNSAEGRAILAGMETVRFIRANDADYQVVRTFVQHFEKEVRMVKAP
jgi:phosphonate transport system substrate-binding protein